MKKISFLFSAIIFLQNVSFSQTLRERIKERREQRSESKSEDVDPAPPDYSDLYYWAAHPGKWDYSDSIPSFLNDKTCDTNVDVFFLHPTTYIRDARNANMNADVDDSALNHQTDITTILYQASLFNGNCRVFAPRYRQAHLKAYFQITSEESKKAFDLAYGDLKTAFQYYLDHWNQGRPIIIAAHSQGSMHAVRLLKEFFVKRENGNSLCINPVSWTTNNNWTPKEMHRGAIGKDFNKLISKRISVEVAPDINVLWVELPEDIEQKSGLASRLGNFHIADYNLFWMDIRENVKQRVDAYIHKN